MVCVPDRLVSILRVTWAVLICEGELNYGMGEMQITKLVLRRHCTLFNWSINNILKKVSQIKPYICYNKKIKIVEETLRNGWYVSAEIAFR